MLASYVVAGVLLLGQTSQGMSRPQPATRDSSQVKKGTSVIRGKVTNADGRPLRRVQIRVSGDVPGASHTASTNGLGRFEVTELAAGRYTVSASRAGYLSIQYGQSKPGDLAAAVNVTDGQTLEDINLTMIRGTVISGRVLDETGEPLAGATVVPLQMRYFSGRRRLTPMRTAITDDTGQYRVSGLDAGEYYLQVLSRETWETDPPEKLTMGFMPTYFPGTPDPAAAQRIRLKAGQDLPSVDVTLVPGKAAQITGTVMGRNGIPLAGETISLGTEIKGETFSSMSSSSGTKINADGSFQMRNVAPGEYHLRVSIPATPERPAEAANIIVNVQGAALDGVNLVTSIAGVFRGRVLVDGGAVLPVPLSGLTIRAMPVDKDTPLGFGPFDAGRIQDNATWELKGVNGPQRLTVSGLPDGWAVRSADFEGHDASVQPLDPQGRTLDGISIIVTNRFPVASGSVLDTKGNPAVGASVLLFPDDSSLWQEDTRAVRTGRSDAVGAFELKAVRPGDYLAVAVPSLSNNQWNDPEYLESLRAQAQHVTIREAEPMRLSLALKAPGS